MGKDLWFSMFLDVMNHIGLSLGRSPKKAMTHIHYKQVIRVGSGISLPQK